MLDEEKEEDGDSDPVFDQELVDITDGAKLTGNLERPVRPTVSSCPDACGFRGPCCRPGDGATVVTSCSLCGMQPSLRWCKARTMITWGFVETALIQPGTQGSRKDQLNRASESKQAENGANRDRRANDDSYSGTNFPVHNTPLLGPLAGGTGVICSA